MKALKTISKVFIMISFSVGIFSCTTTKPVPEQEQPEVPIEEPEQEQPQKKEETPPEPSKPWATASSLDDLYGVWSCGSGFFEYPFQESGKKYLHIANNWQEDTQLWQEFADKNNTSLSEVWKMRYAVEKEVYTYTAANGKNYTTGFIRSDENGIQQGKKLKMDTNGRIFSRMEMLIPERLLVINLNYFLMSPDKTLFKENGTFRLASDVFDDLPSIGNIYTKK